MMLSSWEGALFLICLIAPQLMTGYEHNPLYAHGLYRPNSREQLNYSRPINYEYDFVRTRSRNKSTVTQSPVREPIREPIQEPVTRSPVCPPPQRIIQNCRSTEVILNLTGIGLKRIGDVFIGSPDATELYLDGNDITEISVVAFESLTRLRVLSLNRNNISVDKLLWFKHNNLQKLVLNDNRRRDGKTSVKNMLQPLPRLRELSLKRNGITEWSVNLKSFAPTLARLCLTGNDLVSSDFLDDIPETLSHLHLDDNKISWVKTAALSNVTELFVSGNRIEVVCGANCTGYSSLSLTGMTRLQELNASRNRIAEITRDAFADTKRLVSLDLSQNDIQTLPNDVFDRTTIERLSLSHNKLILITRVCSLTRLKRLDLSNNQITAVTKESFCNQQQQLYIDTLLLANNRIGVIEDDAFAQLPYLRTLDLSGNLIVDFPTKLIGQSSPLRVLVLRNNSIANIDKLFLINSNMLQELHLQQNLFSSIRFPSMPKLVTHLTDVSPKSLVVDASIERRNQNNYIDDDDNDDDDDDDHDEDFY